MIVVDANVIVPLLLPTPQSEIVEHLYAHDCEWRAPRLWPLEFTNVLMAYARKSLVTPVQGRIALGEAAIVLSSDRELAPDSQDVFALALASNCTAYDCEYVAVARQLGASLVTWNRRLLAALPDDTATPEQLLAGQGS